MLGKRETLIKKATELFAREGYHTVGIDRIVNDARVAKMTMYKFFPSKTDLIAEVLTERDKAFRHSLMSYVDQHEAHSDKVKAVFVWHDKWFKRKDFNGCMFINASAEFHDQKDPIHTRSAHHKQQITAYLKTLYINIDPKNAEELAMQTSMLLDGAIVAAHVCGNKNAAIDAWDIVRRHLMETKPSTRQIRSP